MKKFTHQISQKPVIHEGNILALKNSAYNDHSLPAFRIAYTAASKSYKEAKRR